jgi:hypothetical protein
VSVNNLDWSVDLLHTGDILGSHGGEYEDGCRFFWLL